MKRRKLMTIVMCTAALAAGTMMSGCSSDKTEQTEAAQEKVTEAATAAAEAETAAETAAAEVETEAATEAVEETEAAAEVAEETETEAAAEVAEETETEAAAEVAEETETEAAAEIEEDTVTVEEVTEVSEDVETEAVENETETVEEVTEAAETETAEEVTEAAAEEETELIEETEIIEETELAEEETELVEEETEASSEAEALEDGLYSAVFTTDSGMFHVNEAYENKGVLTVENGEMTLHISMPSQNIVNLFLGTAEDAQKDGAELLMPTLDTVTYSDGAVEQVYGFDIPVPVLNEEFDLALIGTKGKWYDHTVSVSDAVLISEEDLADFAEVAELAEAETEFVTEAETE